MEQQRICSTAAKNSAVPSQRCPSGSSHHARPHVIVGKVRVTRTHVPDQDRDVEHPAKKFKRVGQAQASKRHLPQSHLQGFQRAETMEKVHPSRIWPTEA